MTTIQIPVSRQGQPGRGQGGWTAYELVRAIGQPATVALRSPIPLDTNLDILHLHDSWQLVSPADPETVILEATRWEPDYPATEPVSIPDATRARSAFRLSADEHPAPHCVSCGLEDHSLRVHAGPLGDGRWATPLRVPTSVLVDGAVDEGLIWMAMDCASAWFIAQSGAEDKHGVTVQFAVDVHEPIQAETDYALVAWHGDYAPDWEGRKRGAAAALFTASGRCVAQSRSFWIAV